MLVGATLFGVAKAAPRTAQSSTDGAQGTQALARERVEYRLSTEGLAEKVAATGELTLQLTDRKVPLTLREFDLFLPGEKRVVTRDDAGNIVSDVPYLGRTFKGSVTGAQAERAFVLIAPEGLYGAVDVSGREYSIQPAKGSLTRGVRGLEEVTVVADDMMALRRSAGTPPLAPTDSTTYNIYLKPYADHPYAQYASDFANRISSAYSYVESMWESETDITQYLYAIEDTGTSFSYSGTCGGVSDNGRDAFRSNWIGGSTPHHFIGPNAYELFSASGNPGAGVAGCSNPRNLQAVGTINDYAVTAHQGKDWYQSPPPFGDTYDPDETAHLGIIEGHELTHDAGEDTHPTDSNGPCNHNIMDTNDVGGFWCAWAWRASSTISKVKSFAYPRIYHA